MTTLDVSDHRRDITGMTYVYPVVSRRAAGVSIGINLNPNNACNWRCIYCQVPGLIRGTAPIIDTDQLEAELHTMLTQILHGDFMQREVPEPARNLRDIAFSGNGEPTSAAHFDDIVQRVQSLMRAFAIADQIKLRLITNGSLMDRPEVQQAITTLGQGHGEVWFKIDAGTAEGYARINDVTQNPQQVVRRLRASASRCPTWVQTCLFALDGQPPEEEAIMAWLDLLNQSRSLIAGVHLYGIARNSHQPESARLSRLDATTLATIANRARALGIQTEISP